MQHAYPESGTSFRAGRGGSASGALGGGAGGGGSGSGAGSNESGHSYGASMAPLILGKATESSNTTSSRSSFPSSSYNVGMPHPMLNAPPMSSASASGSRSASMGYYSPSSSGGSGNSPYSGNLAAHQQKVARGSGYAYGNNGNGAYPMQAPVGQPFTTYGVSTGAYSHPSPHFGHPHVVGSHHRRSDASQTQTPSPSSEQDQASAASAAQRQSGITPLRRGQACQACRRRKLKCDAVRPICGTCEKSRKAAAQANHVSPVPDGDCVYDDGGPDTPVTSSATGPSGVASSARSGQKRQRVSTGGISSSSHAAVAGTASGGAARGGKGISVTEGVGGKQETSEERIVRLESRVVELEERLRLAKLQQAHSWDTGTTPRRFRSRASSREPVDGEESSRPAVPIISMLSPLSGREERHRMRYFQRPARFGHPSNLSSSPAYSAAYPSDGLGNVTKSEGKVGEIGVQEEVITEIGVSDISPTDESFMQLLWPGWSSDLPSADTVTSLCETFFRLHPMRTMVYKPSFMSGLLLPPRHPHRPHDSLIHAVLCAAADISPFYEHSTTLSGVRDRFSVLMSDPFSRPNLQQPQSADMLTFKEFHLSKARQKVERSLITDFKNPLDWLSALLISCFVLWNDRRFVEAYFLSAIAARAMAPAGLDKLPSRHLSSNGKIRNTPGIFGDPQGIEEHERRIVFWHTFIADQYTSGPPSFYENMLQEQACLTNLPCKMSDFMAGNDVAPNTQLLSSPDLFTDGHLDDFTLHIKSCVLLRRAGTLTCRTQMSRSKPPGLAVVDRHINEFMASFPPFSIQDVSCDSLVALTNVSLAMFYLHEPYLNTSALCTVKEAEPSATSSNGRILLAIEKMMEVLHQLMNCSLDFALIHPQTFLTWSVGARMMCKDMTLLQKRQQQQAAANGAGVKQEDGSAGPEDKPRKPLVADERAAMARISENLNTIIHALRRGGIKSLKAKRCAELISSVRSGHLHEMVLSHLLYLDGVIPVEEELAAGGGVPDFGPTFAPFPEADPFDMLMLSAPAASMSTAENGHGKDLSFSAATIMPSAHIFSDIDDKAHVGGNGFNGASLDSVMTELDQHGLNVSSGDVNESNTLLNFAS